MKRRETSIASSMSSTRSTRRPKSAKELSCRHPADPFRAPGGTRARSPRAPAGLRGPYPKSATRCWGPAPLRSPHSDTTSRRRMRDCAVVVAALKCGWSKLEPFGREQCVTRGRGVSPCEDSVERGLIGDKAPFGSERCAGHERKGREPVAERERHLRLSRFQLCVMRRDDPHRVRMLLVHPKRGARQRVPSSSLQTADADPEADPPLPHEVCHVTLRRPSGLEPGEMDVLRGRDQPAAGRSRDRNTGPAARSCTSRTRAGPKRPLP